MAWTFTSEMILNVDESLSMLKSTLLQTDISFCTTHDSIFCGKKELLTKYDKIAIAPKSIEVHGHVKRDRILLYFSSLSSRDLFAVGTFLGGEVRAVLVRSDPLLVPLTYD